MRLSDHVHLRMTERHFSEVELRTMLEDAHAIEPDIRYGRWRVLAHHAGWTWEVIVEPDPAAMRLVVITAYRLD